MSQSVQGTIEKIITEQKFGNTRKSFLILKTDENYPQILQIEFINDKISLMDGYDVGEKVEVAINIRGREWTSPTKQVKYFTTLAAWKIDRTVGLTNTAQNPDRQNQDFESVKTPF